MGNWWSLGEGSGYDGNELALYRIECPFCGEKGNFSTKHHAEKKKPNSKKILNFDTLQCGNCSSYTMAFWSACEHPGSRGIHDYKVLPWPLKYSSHPEEWPQDVGQYWLEAKRSLTSENWNAAAVMARSALQCTLRQQGAAGNNLKKEIDDLADKGLLPPIMKEWAHELRELGNNSAHPTPGSAGSKQTDAIAIVNFLDYLLRYIYTLPHQIDQYRTRKANGSTQP